MTHLRLGEVGVWTYQLDLQPADRARAAAAELESLGFGALWISDARRREIFTNASLLLGATSRLVVATGIASIYGRDPTTMACAQKTLAEAFPDRFLLGLGVSHRASWKASEVMSTGPRRRRCGPTCWRCRGSNTSLPEATAGGCPTVLGAMGPRMLELARDLTAGAHPYHTTPEHTHRAREILGPAAFLAPSNQSSSTRTPRERGHGAVPGEQDAPPSGLRPQPAPARLQRGRLRGGWQRPPDR